MPVSLSREDALCRLTCIVIANRIATCWDTWMLVGCFGYPHLLGILQDFRHSPLSFFRLDCYIEYFCDMFTSIPIARLM